MGKLSTMEMTALVLTIIGGVNWGLVGLINLNIVSMVVGDMTVLSRVVYILVGLSAVYVVLMMKKLGKREEMMPSM